MSKLTLFLRSIALCLFFPALRTRGVRLRPTIQELKGNDSIAHDILHGVAKQNLKRLNSNSIAFGRDPSIDEPFLAVHIASPGDPDDNYYGLHATIGVHNHKLIPGQWSSAGIWVYHTGDGVKSSFNSIQVGWHIDPDRYTNSNPHFYTQWTRDDHDATGCINMECPGYVRVNGAAIGPGDFIPPGVSEVDIPNITLRVVKDKNSGDWWVYYGYNSVPTGVGYYPRSLFTYLADKASDVAFGGAVVAYRQFPTPPMGSGSFPNDGPCRAAAFTDLRFIDQDGNSKPIMADLSKSVTNDKCHSITPIENGAFLYGGPANCVR